MRPTLEEQIKASKMTEDELIELLAPSGNLDFWIFRHSHLAWNIIHWNWFNIYTGEKGLWNYIKRWRKEK